MKMKNRNWIYSLLQMGVCFVIMTSCLKIEDLRPVLSPITFNPGLTYGTVSDVDGNTYKTITIGTQTWMAENLRTTKYRNGEAIPNVTDATAWKGLTSGACCRYNNTTNNDTIATFGLLYNWYAATDSRNIAPDGWHIPSDAEWTTLTTFLLGDTIAGGKLKEADISHWKNFTGTNVGATNETGFTALPGGSRSYESALKFAGLKYNGLWWSSTEFSATAAWFRVMTSGYKSVGRKSVNKYDGFSLRCIKD